MVINTNAALRGSEQRIGWGIAAKDQYGRLKQAWAIPSRYCRSAQVEEAMTIRIVLEKSIQMGWTNFQIQSDCKRVVDKINSNLEDMKIENILLDIGRLKQEVGSCAFTYVNRSRNELGHQLAKFVMHCYKEIS
ncbi:hypothetical protein ACH5RR_015280 [Cinchona calisaya]|uniref:RNase H type-1 domain-containing protein n=1 Tax=Cinchona calisaya TaxID=153742 RepID=A0ABD2ZUH3_9GENT